jgi:hypothetical protein
MSQFSHRVKDFTASNRDTDILPCFVSLIYNTSVHKVLSHAKAHLTRLWLAAIIGFSPRRQSKQGPTNRNRAVTQTNLIFTLSDLVTIPRSTAKFHLFWSKRKRYLGAESGNCRVNLPGSWLFGCLFRRLHDCSVVLKFLKTKSDLWYSLNASIWWKSSSSNQSGYVLFWFSYGDMDLLTLSRC